MITKRIWSDSFDFGVPAASLIPLFSKGVDSGYFQKRAAVFDSDLGKFQTRPGYTYIHLITTGAGERYSCNSNADYFNKEARVHRAVNSYKPGVEAIMLDGGLKKYHNDTFTKLASVYKNHCFPAGSPVRMADGSFKPIEFISIGDLVHTRSGAKKVVNTFCRPYKGKMISFIAGARSVTCTADHPMFALKRSQTNCRHKYSILGGSLRGKNDHRSHCKEFLDMHASKDRLLIPNQIAAEALLKDDWLVTAPVAEGAVRLNELMARLIGWTASEGYIQRCELKGRRLGRPVGLQFTFSQRSTADIEDVIRCLEGLGAHVSRRPTKYGCTALSSRCARIAEEVGKYVEGILNYKRLTSKVFELDDESKKQLLGAYVDGDGNVSRRFGGLLRIRSSSPEMLAVLQDLIESLGAGSIICVDNPNGHTFISPTNKKTYHGRPSGFVSSEGKMVQPLLTYSRKQDSGLVKTGFGSNWSTKVLNGLVLRRITSRIDTVVEEEIPVYNLEVEDVHEYDVNGILVHNCNKHKDGVSSGYIVKAAYNEDMDRGELIVGLENNKWEKELQKLANEQPVYFSMAADVEHDSCSYCLHPASRRSDYCEHLKDGMNMITKEGHKICAINDAPMFHDISGVLRPADKIAVGLRKVASACDDACETLDGVPSVRTMRYAAGKAPAASGDTLDKLADIEKKITLAPVGSAEKTLVASFQPANGYGKADDKALEKLSACDAGDLFTALKDRLVLLSFDGFMKVAMGSRIGEIAPYMDAARSQVPGIFGRLQKEAGLIDFLEDGSYEPSGIHDLSVYSSLDPLMASHSLSEDAVRSRVVRSSLAGNRDEAGIMYKQADAMESPEASMLAREYARYVLSFADGLNPGQLDLTVAQTMANVR